MADITDEQLKEEVREILKGANLEQTSRKTVVQKLEKKLCVDLTDRKKVIFQYVMEYVNENDSDKDDDEGDDDEENEDEVEEEAPKKRATRKRKASDDDSGAKKTKPKAAPKSKKAGGRKGSSCYTRLYKMSPALSNLMGKDEMRRHEVVKRIWEIIKEKNLYDPNNKQFVVCDEPFLKVFGTKRFRAFGMMKYLTAHFIDE